VEKRESFWRGRWQRMSRLQRYNRWLQRGGNVVAFVSGARETGQLGCDGELYAIYLRQEAQRRDGKFACPSFVTSWLRADSFHGRMGLALKPLKEIL